MPDTAEVARLLDILGNRNRRRIIELLRQKPCFVTEISETLMLSPKAVIEHLQMMEREDILSCQTDDRRRKYYYLANDILVEVSLRQPGHEHGASDPGRSGVLHPENRKQLQEKERESAERGRFLSSVAMLARMIRAHDQLADSLDQLNHDIEIKITDLARNHKDILQSEHELSVIIALCHESLTLEELVHVTGSSDNVIAPLLRRLGRCGIVDYVEGRYALRGVHAEQG